MTEDNMVENLFHKKLKIKIHNLVMMAYDITDKFPYTERYGASSQLRRAIVSVMLNYVEGFARFREKVKQNFYEIAYGSARESKYLIFLASERKWIEKGEYDKAIASADEVSRMLYSLIDTDSATKK